MAVLLVLAEKENADLDSRVRELYPKESYQLSGNQWLIAADVNARSVADALDIRTGRFGRVLIMPAAGPSSGWHNRSAWQWLQENVQGLQ